MATRNIACQECGKPASDARKTQAFCCTGCRVVFNNRRKTRGADAYDLIRALRRERSTAKSMNIWTELCRLELSWDIEDKAARPGRRSYIKPEAALAHLYDKGALHRGDVLVKGKSS